MARITLVPLDSTARVQTPPIKGELSILTPAGDAARRVLTVRDLQDGKEYGIEENLERLELVEVVATNPKQVFGPLARTGIDVSRKNLCTLVIGGVAQSPSVFSFCSSNGTAVNSGLATHIKIDAEVPVGVKVVFRYAIPYTFGTMAPLV